MKNLLTLIISLCVATAYAQFPVTQTNGGLTTIVITKGALKADTLFVNATYPDTLKANANPYLKSYPGGQIFTTSDNSVWYRNALATAWIKYASGTIASGTVTSFSKTDNFGITSSVTNPTTTPNHAVAVDSIVVTSRIRHTNDSAALRGLINTNTSNIALKVSSVTATSPILSSGGTAPNISMPAATSSVNGYLTSADHLSFSNRLQSLTGSIVNNADPLNPVISIVGHNSPLANNWFGGNAAFSNTGSNVLAIGDGAGQYNTGNTVNAIGNGSAGYNTGSSVNILGTGAGFENSGANIIAIGTNAGQTNSGSNVNILGRGAGASNPYSHVTLLGNGATADANKQLVFSDSTYITRFNFASITANRKLTVPNYSGKIIVADSTTEGAGKYLTISAAGAQPTWGTLAGGGTVTSFSKTDNFGITSSVINPTTTPTHAVAVDTLVILSRIRHTNDSAALRGLINTNTSNIALKVSSVTATSPILSSGGTAPNISMPAATSSVNGYLAAADHASFSNRLQSLTGSIVNNADPLNPVISVVGYNAALDVNWFGNLAASENTGTSVNAIGVFAAQGNTADNVNAIGNSAAKNNTGQNVNANGRLAAQGNTGVNVNANGNNAGFNNTFSNVDLSGSNSTADADKQQVFNNGLANTRWNYNSITANRKLTVPNYSGKIIVADSTTEGAGKYLTISAAGAQPTWGTLAGGGTVTSFSKTDNFGITSSVINPTTTPTHAVAVDTLVILSRIRHTNDSAALRGLINTNTTNISLKQNLVTLTTTGTSGASTFNQSTGALNIPSYAGGVTGSGTLNYIPKWTPSGTALGNSLIFDNGTGIGIGTTSPNALQHLISASEQLRIGFDASKYVSTTVGSTGDVTHNIVGGGTAYINYSGVNKYIYASTGSAQFADLYAAGVDNRFTGKVNIGSGSFATNTLDVVGTVGVTTSASVGSLSAAASAILDVTSTTKGFLPPRMTAAQMVAISSPATGLEIYNTSTNTKNIFNGTNWTGGLTASSAATLTIIHGQDYVFTGTTSTWTLPAVSATLLGRGNSITIKNRGTGAITLNSNAGSTIYSSIAVGTFTISPGEAIMLMPDGTFFNIE